MALLHCGSLGKWQFSNNSGKSGVIAKLLAKQALIAKWTSRFVQVVGYMLHGNIHKPNVEIVETPAFRHIYSFKWFFMTYLMKSITWTKRSREGRSVDLARIGTVLNIMRHVCPSVCWKIKKKIIIISIWTKATYRTHTREHRLISTPELSRTKISSRQRFAALISTFNHLYHHVAEWRTDRWHFKPVFL